MVMLARGPAGASDISRKPVPVCPAPHCRPGRDLIVTFVVPDGTELSADGTGMSAYGLVWRRMAHEWPVNGRQKVHKKPTDRPRHASDQAGQRLRGVRGRGAS
jgi:hypothetical protein